MNAGISERRQETDELRMTRCHTAGESSGNIRRLSRCQLRRAISSVGDQSPNVLLGGYSDICIMPTMCPVLRPFLRRNNFGGSPCYFLNDLNIVRNGVRMFFLVRQNGGSGASYIVIRVTETTLYLTVDRGSANPAGPECLVVISTISI